MDIASLVGLVVGFGLMIFGIVYGNSFSVIFNFLNAPSALITFGGAFCAVMTSYSMKDYIKNLKAISGIFKPPVVDETGTIRNIIDLSNVARKEGLLALEDAANDLDDEFLKKGILLIVDGTDPELVRGILETELMCMEERHKDVMGFWENIASMGPAWGMIGTLIGLVNMLQDMSDPSSIGPAMAVALLTTLYGSVLANWLSLPAAAKMKANNAVEVMIREVMIEGLLSIQAGENPRVIEEKLKSFLAPKDREALNQNDGGEEADG